MDAIDPISPIHPVAPIAYPSEHEEGTRKRLLDQIVAAGTPHAEPEITLEAPMAPEPHSWLA